MSNKYSKILIYSAILTLTLSCRHHDNASMAFQETDGIVAMEAQNAHEIVGWQPVEIENSLAMQDTSSRQQGFLIFDIEITNPGKYFVFLHCLAPEKSTSKNDCFVTLNDEKLYSIADEETRPDGMRVHSDTLVWTFLPKGPGAHTPDAIRDKPVYADIKEPGVHTLKIGSRSKGFVLDKIRLNRGDSSVPIGESEEDEL